MNIILSRLTLDAISGLDLTSLFRNRKREFNSLTNDIHANLLRQLTDLQNGTLNIVPIDADSISKYIRYGRKKDFRKVCKRHQDYQRQAGNCEIGRGSVTFRQAMFRHLIASDKVLLEYLEPR